MVDASDSTRGVDELAPRHVLEAMIVPELPADFADRVMVALAPAGVVTTAPRSSRLPWAVAAATTAFAVAAMLTLVWSLPARTPEPSQPSQPSQSSEPTPVVVAAPPPAPAPSLGHLVLEVEPADATVRIDGALVSGPSPFVVTNLAIGRHAIEVEREGYERWSRTVDLPSGPLALPIALQATAKPATSVAPLDPGAFLPPAKPRPSKRSRPAASKPSDLVDPFPFAKVPPKPGVLKDPYATSPRAGVY